MWSLLRLNYVQSVTKLSRIPRPGKIPCRKFRSNYNDSGNGFKWILGVIGTSVGGIIAYFNYDNVRSWAEESPLWESSYINKMVTKSTPEGFRLPTTPVIEMRKDTARQYRKKGLVLGVYEKTSGDKVRMIPSPAAKHYSSASKAKLDELIEMAGPILKIGESRLFYGIDPEYDCVAIVGLGPEDAGLNTNEDIEEGKENVRRAMAAGSQQLRDVGCLKIEVDPCKDSEAAAEGASLGLFFFDELKSEESKKKKVKLDLYNYGVSREEWELGLLNAKGQNLARRLMELPANLLTPSAFAEIATETLASKNIQVTTRGKQWIMDQKMGSFLGVAKGSEQPPVFLEIHYNGGNSKAKPVVLVGKGVTFDSGGISLKPSKDMDEMRADMGGGACIVATMNIIAELKIPINIVGLIPLCENMPGGAATKPGDVLTTMNGTTIQVDNTDAEGRLILADALCYAQRFDPLVIVDLATLTGSMVIALGEGATGAFCTTSTMWDYIHQAGVKTGDRFWRMPLYGYYTKRMKKSHLADLNNIACSSAGGACTAAAFLKEFVTTENWIHLDIAGVMMTEESDVAYLTEGMSGRPTRGLVEFIKILSMNLPKKRNIL